jgi:hypothetical protein
LGYRQEECVFFPSQCLHINQFGNVTTNDKLFVIEPDLQWVSKRGSPNQINSGARDQPHNSKAMTDNSGHMMDTGNTRGLTATKR